MGDDGDPLLRNLHTTQGSKILGPQPRMGCSRQLGVLKASLHEVTLISRKSNEDDVYRAKTIRGRLLTCLLKANGRK
jgi:hypothetical protein